MAKDVLLNAFQDWVFYKGDYLLIDPTKEKDNVIFLRYLPKNKKNSTYLLNVLYISADQSLIGKQGKIFLKSIETLTSLIFKRTRSSKKIQEAGFKNCLVFRC